MVVVLALHAGAGNLSGEAICAKALKKISSNFAIKPNLLQQENINGKEKQSNEKSQLVSCLMELEKRPELNCGIGSNLTETGNVECEAAFICSTQLAFGAVSSVTNCVHPILAAQWLSDPYRQNCIQNGLITPMILVGSGANEFCTSMGIGIVSNNRELVSESAEKDYFRAKKLLNTTESGRCESDERDYAQMRLDTVGGVSIELESGYAEACVSSGGILLKKPGRMGHSASFGAAIWAEQRDLISIAITLSGCGEALTRTKLAENLAEFTFSRDLQDPLLPDQIKTFLERHFLYSNRVSAFPPDRLLLAGLMLIRTDSSSTQLIAFHNTRHFPLAYLGGGSGRAIGKYKSVNEKDNSAFVCIVFNL